MNQGTLKQKLPWSTAGYLYGGIWLVTLPDGTEFELKCNSQRGVGFRAIQCFGFDAAQKSTYTRKSL